MILDIYFYDLRDNTFFLANKSNKNIFTLLKHL